ncbi:hypothetical protein BGZ83_008901, partial [Gryganskiella cystojenkinii]
EGGTRILKDALEAIKDRESPTFTVEEGIKFKRAWYRAVRTAESYIQTGKLVQFKDLVTTAPCRHQLMFQWGICQLLGQFAADTKWDLVARRNAVAFLGSLCRVDRSDRIWYPQKEIDQVIFDVLTEVVSNDTQFTAAKTLLEEIGKQNTALISILNLPLPPWRIILSKDPAENTTPLLKAVQDRNRRHAKIENLPDLPRLPSRDDIQSALKTYHAPDLFILRVSGQELDLKTCFVNLAIVEAPAHRHQEKKDLKDKTAVFHRIPSFERVKHTDTNALIPLEHLFDKRRLRDGLENAPKRILVQGRAGIGKTTLCKKLVHVHQNGLWKDLFDFVLWLPLRQLRGSKSRTLEDLFREKVFIAQDFDQEQAALAHALTDCAQKGKVLFVLDGLDEIVTDDEGDESKTFKSFLKTLLCQQHVVITSRSSGLDSTLLPPIDLELETVGFSQQNVKDFVIKVLEPEAAETVQDFIQRTPLIQGLVNIPVQLDVICFSWDSLPSDGRSITMTGLYQLMVRNLWCKDALRLKKTAGGKDLTQRQISQLSPEDVDELMATELQHLGYLAFKGMNNSHQIEFDQNDLLCAFRDLKDYAADKSRLLPPQLVEVMKQTSFLHTTDVDLDSRNGGSRQVWHFLHLTFQEYFAATWIVRHFHLKERSPSTGMMTVEQVAAFIHQHKYNPQYEIVWSMVAGLLEGEPLSDFFGLLQGAPRDLIGGRHQQILALCLSEARIRLDSAVVVALDSELTEWLRFEMQICQHDDYSRSMLGSHFSFPEVSLVETLGSVCSWKTTLVHTLEARPAISDSGIQFLIAALKDEDGDVRLAAASALGKQSALPESAIQYLIASLEDEEKDVRSAAVSVFSKWSVLPESAIQSLIAALKDEDEYVRYSAASALGRQSTLPESVIQSLIAALKDKDKGVRSAAVSVFSKRSTLPESAIPSLIATLKDKDKYVGYSAASALGSQSMLPESAIRSLIYALEDGDEDVRYLAASALGKQSTLPESAIRSLIAALKDKDKDVRSSAASALGKKSMLPESAIHSLTAALKDKDKDVRSAAVSVFGKQSMLPESAIQSLIDALKDTDKYVRYSAASALGSQSILPESAILSLIAALEDEEKDVRALAASALGSQSMSPESAIQSLIAALKDEEKDVRSAAASALGNKSALPESAIQSLISALKDINKDVRSSAASALGKQSTLSESTIQSLIAALKDEEKDVRSAAASALGSQSMLPESTIQSLIAALKDEEKDVRYSAASALGKQSTLPESAVHSLIAALKDEEKDVRSTSVSVFGKQSTWPESAIQSLTAALKYDDKDVRYSAASALGKQSTLPESAIHSLIAALKHEEKEVRSAAVSVIGKQSTLTESAIQSLTAALKDIDKDVRSAAVSVFGKQSTLPESAIYSLTAALKDEEKDVRYSAASALGNQSMLQESAIHSLVTAFKDEDEDVRRSVSETLRSQCRSLCISLPHLTGDEIACLYVSHLFLYSCSHVMSLQVQDGRLCLYSEQGVLRSEPIGKDSEKVISLAFRAVHRKAGFRS